MCNILIVIANYKIQNKKLDYISWIWYHFKMSKMVLYYSLKPLKVVCNHQDKDDVHVYCNLKNMWHLFILQLI